MSYLNNRRGRNVRGLVFFDGDETTRAKRPRTTLNSHIVPFYIESLRIIMKIKRKNSNIL
jgi:hypothetical protein